MNRGDDVTVNGRSKISFGLGGLLTGILLTLVPVTFFAASERAEYKMKTDGNTVITAALDKRVGAIEVYVARLDTQTQLLAQGLASLRDDLLQIKTALGIGIRPNKGDLK